MRTLTQDDRDRAIEILHNRPIERDERIICQTIAYCYLCQPTKCLNKQYDEFIRIKRKYPIYNKQTKGA